MKLEKITLELNEEELQCLICMTEEPAAEKYWDNVRGAEMIKMTNKLNAQLIKIQKATNS